MIKQIQIFMPSAKMQDAVACIIREIIFFKDTQRETSVSELLNIIMQIFVISSQPHAMSHCIYTFLETFCRAEKKKKKQ